MSLDKAIQHNKEHRKQYRGSKAFDCTANRGAIAYREYIGQEIPNMSSTKTATVHVRIDRNIKKKGGSDPFRYWGSSICRHRRLLSSDHLSRRHPLLPHNSGVHTPRLRRDDHYRVRPGEGLRPCASDG